VITPVPGGVVLEIKVIPRAGRTAVAGERDGALLVRLASAPVDGAANDALIALLADTLGVAKRHVTIVSGAHARRKRVRIEGVTDAQISARLVHPLAE
jgi:uncharacterized protein (TIGR00251 family)